MTKIKIGIIRENPLKHDKRVAFTPQQCHFIKDAYKDVDVIVQPSQFRCYSDEEYRNEGIALSSDLSNCDILIGIKEVAPDELIDGKKYFFFSHTIKEQERNRNLLKEILNKKITLIDYECLVDNHNNRIIGFGRYAGIVGAYNGLMGYGIKYGLFNLRHAEQCHDKKELWKELDQISLPNMKVVITGGGRVANGAIETLGALNMRKVTPFEFLNYSFREPVYVQLHSEDYHEHKEGRDFVRHEFYTHPEYYRCTFADPGSYASHCDLLIHCSFWNVHAPVLFTKQQMREPTFRISVIADVTCDINGSIPSTQRSTTIEDKFFGYNPDTEREEDPFAHQTITVMAVDNLPCELPRDASEGFGKHLIERVLPSLIGNAGYDVIERATIASEGKLTDRFRYLSNFAVSA